MIFLVAFKATFVGGDVMFLNEELLKDLNAYIDNNLIRFVSEISHEYKFEDISPEIDGYIKKNIKPSFSEVLFEYIDAKGVSDSDIYKKACIDRRHFSKIRSNPYYRVSKNTAICLALALELDKEDANRLLNSAGYSLSYNDKFDLIIQFCIEKKIYDIFYINEILYYFSLKPLT